MTNSRAHDRGGRSTLSELEPADGAVMPEGTIPPAVRVAVETAVGAGLPYVGLRDLAIDATLFHYIPRSLAVEQCLAPLLLIGDSLTVASPRPDPELEPIARRFPKLDLRLVISAEPEIRALLAGHADAPASGSQPASTPGPSR